MRRVLPVILTLGAVGWSAALFLAPYALSSKDPRLVAAAASVYQASGLICHQRSARSFHLAGLQQPVCARCTGLYVSAAAGALATWLLSRRPRVPRRSRLILAVAALPTALSVVLEVAGFVHPSNSVRALWALPLGASAAWIVVQSLRAEASDESRVVLAVDRSS